MSRLNELYKELHRVNAMSEYEVMKEYNADCKQDIVDLIMEDIGEEELQDGVDADDGMDYDALCYSQGISRYC